MTHLCKMPIKDPVPNYDYNCFCSAQQHSIYVSEMYKQLDFNHQLNIAYNYLDIISQEFNEARDIILNFRKSRYDFVASPESITTVITTPQWMSLRF